MSKGSARRPGDETKLAENWARTFGGLGRRNTLEAKTQLSVRIAGHDWALWPTHLRPPMGYVRVLEGDLIPRVLAANTVYDGTKPPCKHEVWVAYDRWPDTEQCVRCLIVRRTLPEP